MAGVARKLAVGSTSRALNLVCSAAASIVIAPIIVHSLGDRAYGLWALIGNVIGYYNLLDLGLTTAVNRHMAVAFGAKDEEASNRYFNTSLVLYSLIGLVVFLVSGVLAIGSRWFHVTPQEASELAKVFLILGVSTAIGFPRRALAGTLNAKLEFDTTSRLDLLTIVLRATLNVLFVKIGFGLVGLAFSLLLSDLPSFLLYIRYTKTKVAGLTWKLGYWSKKTAKELFSYSSFSFVTQVSDLVRLQMDAMVVSACVGVAAVTHYQIAGTLAQYYIAVVVAFIGVFQSVFSQQFGAGNRERMESTFLFATKISILVSSFIAFGLIAWGKPFIQRWMGPAYTDSYLPLVVLVSGFVVALWQNPSTALLNSFAKHRYYALFNTIEAAANLGLSIWLARRMGIVGVALGTFIPMMFMKTIVQPLYVCLATGFDYGKYMRTCLGTLIKVAVSLAVPAYLSWRFAAPRYVVLAGLGVVSGIIYLGINWFTQFNGDESSRLQRAILPGGLAREQAAR